VCMLLSYLKSLGFYPETDDGFIRGESCETVAERVVSRRPRAIGLSINAEREISEGLKLVQALRQKGYKGPIIAGGAFAAMEQVRLLQDHDIDYVVVGDGEEPFAELLSAIIQNKKRLNISGVAGSGKVPAVKRAAIKNLDRLPYMDRSIFRRIIEHNGGSLSGLQATVSTGRGCFANCAFCSIKSFARMNTGPSYRERSVFDIVEEMKRLYREFGIKDFYFCSGQFLAPNLKKSREKCAWFKACVAELPFRPSIFLYIRCDNVTREIVEDLRDAGVTTLFVGVESFDHDTLRMLRKDLSPEEIISALQVLESAGYSADYRSFFRLKVGFIMFTPWTNLRGMDRNLFYCRRFRIPPKKMLYALQVHPDNQFPQGSYNVVERESVHFARLEGEIGEVYRAYSTVLQTVFTPLETMRSYQKADLGLPKHLEKASYELVDSLNDLLYNTFGEILKAAPQGKAKSFSLKAQSHVKQLLEKSLYANLLKELAKATEPSRVSCPEAYLNRGLDNPQVIDPDFYSKGVRYP